MSIPSILSPRVSSLYRFRGSRAALASFLAAGFFAASSSPAAAASSIPGWWGAGSGGAAVLAPAYIGPGAGFAFAGSFLVLFATILLAFGIMAIYPIRMFLRLFKKSKRQKTGVDKVIILGLDGICPKRVQRMMDEGKLPNFKKLADEGCFHELTSTNPSMSPVAWSTFSTGVDPSRHGIFDFFTRNKKNYLPELSSTEIGGVDKTIKLGKYRIPIGKPVLRIKRRAVPFWKIVGAHDLPSTVLRVPISFPPEKHRGLSLSAMCTPDMRGSQGTFSFFTTKSEDDPRHTSGVQIKLEYGADGKTIETTIPGPENPLVEGSPLMEIPMRIVVDRESGRAHLDIDGEEVTLEGRQYSPWVKLVFKPGLGKKVHGIARFCVRAYEPHFELYMTPINIDPGSPVMPISHPMTYAMYLSKLLGPYATLGLAEDTWALNARVLDEGSWLEQADGIHEEREKMFFHSLKMSRKGLIGCVFDGTDRIQHMFMRYEHADHPANKDKDTTEFADTIEKLYEKSDALVGRTLEYVDKKTAIIVMSDHGFTHFSWGVNLNSWLHQNGYLVLEEGCTESGEWFPNVDWTKTRAFALGLTGLFINRKGREGQGIVSKEELEPLKRELTEKLTGLIDDRPGRGVVAINRIFDVEKFYDGPFTDDAPDFIIGYADGYRASWECAVGTVDKDVFVDNTKSWSGDHCLDYETVPGIFFSNRKIDVENPRIMDIAPSVLKLFGIPIPRHMTGQSLYNGSAFPAQPSKIAAEAPKREPAGAPTG